MSAKDHTMENSRLVYSTESGRACPECGKPVSVCGCRKKKTKAGPKPPAGPDDGIVRIRRETKGRGGKTVTVRGEQLARHRRTQKTMPATHWVYNGSILHEGTFLAQQEGSIVALYTDPVALVNFPGPDRDNDENWEPNASVLPEVETLVQVIFRLEKEVPSVKESPVNPAPKH